MRLYFVRHGESEANLLHVFSNHEVPHRLTDTGRQQANELADKLAGVPFDAFYCSPVPRAQESAAILSAKLGIGHVVTPALTEYDVGVLEGHSDAASWERFYAVRDTWFRDRDWDARIEGGESFNDVRARFLPFIDGLLERDGRRNVLLLGHGGTFHCMLPLILAGVTFDLVVANGMHYCDVVIAEQRPNGLACMQW